MATTPTPEELEAMRMTEEMEIRFEATMSSIDDLLYSAGKTIDTNELEAVIISLKAKQVTMLNRLNSLQALIKRSEHLNCLKRVEEAIDKIDHQQNRLDVLRRNPPTMAFNTSNTMNTSFANTTSSHKILTAKLPKLGLPEFDGDAIGFQSFFDRFTASVDSNPELTDVEKLQYLQSSCKGEAGQAVKTYPLTNNGYKMALEDLQENFGSVVAQKNAIMKKLREIKSINEMFPVKPLRNLLMQVSGCVRTLEKLAVPVQTSGVFLMPDVLSKFPPEISQRFYQANSLKEEDVLKLILFIAKEIRIAEMTEHAALLKQGSAKKEKNEKSNKDEKTDTKPRGSMASCAVSQSDESKKKESITKSPGEKSSPSNSEKVKQIICVFCEGNHFNGNCDKVNSQAERYKIVRQKKLCFNCLRKDHGVGECPIKFSCRKCGSRHHTTICNKDEKKPEEPSKDVNAMLPLKVAANIQLMIFSAFAESKDDEKIVIRGILDPGSHRSYISKALVTKLNLQSKGELTSHLQCINDEEPKPKSFQIYQLMVYSKYGNKKLNITALRSETLPKISGIPMGTFLTKLKDLNLELAEDLPSITDEIDVLIGGDFWWNVCLAGRKRINKGVGLNKTIFGWVLNGVTSNTDFDEENASCCNVSCHVSESRIEDMWKLESIGISSGEKTEDFIRDRFEKTSRRLDDGRFEVELPFNSHVDGLQSNWANAINQLSGTLKKLNGNKDHIKRYNDAINTYIEDNHAEVVPEEEMDRDLIYYIPHHPIIREDRETTKFRVVFNASSSKKGTKSLNECLFPGPSLNPDILVVLIRFRLFKIPVVADIKQAFLQVAIKPAHRDVLRFLWVHPEFFEKEYSWANLWNNLKVIRMKVVSFGVNSSPFLLCAAIRQQAKTFELTFPKEVQALDQGIYMDDLVSGSSCPSSTIEHCKKIKEILDKAKMPLVKWITNNKTVDQKLRKNEFVMRTETYEEIDVQKILGVLWNLKEDKLQYKIVKEGLPVNTRREVLSAIAAVFDPLGLLAPVILKMKLLMQQIWQENGGWDTILEEKYQIEVSNWINDIQILRDLKIERWSGTYENKKLELYVFCDASPLAYGCTVYTKNEKEECKLLLTKNRIAPLKKLTLPRLELTAAVIGTRIAKYVTDNLIVGFPIAKVQFFSDSCITLQWITGGKNQWKPYVSNRIGEILESTKPEQWRYINTKCNPADFLTRPQEAKSLLKNELWWNGPANLVEENIPVCELPKEEIKKENISLAIGETENFLDSFMRKFSNLKKLLRVTAYIIRWKNRLRGEISPDELEEAEKRIALLSQKIHFFEEFEDLKNKETVNKKSKLINLDPYIEDDGLIRMKGRLRHADLTFEEKSPIIIDPTSWFCRLLVEKTHKKLLHGDTSETMFRIRNKYWILRARKSISAILRKCLVCQRLRMERPSPQTGDLPTERVTPSNPFANIGIDFLGPIYVKNQNERKSKKVYICLFTCLVTRAVHLEVTEDLSAPKFMLAFRRHSARFGYPEKVFSDNAKTFERGSLILSTWGKLLAHIDVQTVISEYGIKWDFIPPRAPWWGGVWERLVRSVKDKLRKTLKNQFATLEELQTIILEIASILNSRPLTYVSEDPNEGHILSPDNFLTGGVQKMMLRKNLSAIKKKDLHQIEKNRMKYLNRFWSLWKNAYLKQLRNFHEVYGNYNYKNVRKNQVVLVERMGINPYFWPLARIQEAKVGNDGVVRVVRVSTADGKSFVRSVKHIRILEMDESLEKQF